ncbi:MAG: 4-hydroxy-2-oxovalerate aldolase [Clostridia bacterium]|nr:4-hydroxy-2-oxovalerate aldolase [Clostridia bacterium]
MHNQLKRKLKEGKPVVGPFVMSNSPDNVEILSLAGFDFVILDSEHGPMGVEGIMGLIRAAESRGCTPIARVTENTETNILRLLDVGAYGLHVPQVNTKEQAENMVRAAKYYPLGSRGSALARSSGYGLLDVNEYFRKANEETMLIPHIENIQGVENLKEIVKVSGIDVIFVGPMDLSQSLGLPGETHHPKVEETIQRVLDITLDSGLIAGTLALTPEEAARRIEQGFKYIAYSVDTLLLGKIAKKEFEELQKYL